MILDVFSTAKRNRQSLNTASLALSKTTPQYHILGSVCVVKSMMWLITKDMSDKMYDVANKASAMLLWFSEQIAVTVHSNTEQNCET